jgi:group II intron reverse transcriptase/maturase
MDSLEGKTTGTPILEIVSTKLQRIAQLAREEPKRVFLSLAHHIDFVWLLEAFNRTRKGGAPGVDGQTAADYAKEGLVDKLLSLHDRFKSGQYQAPPVRRSYVPKGDGRKTRPIGVPTFEDKVLQRAVTMVLEAVYEQDFLDCSYGFRPGRSAHQAVKELREVLMSMGGGWVLELDIESFFDSLDHAQLRRFLDQRVRDGVLRRAIDKWLKAGVLEQGRWSHPDSGTPQGGVVSPLLANIYLHEVLDKWFVDVVKPRLFGQAILIRYADDAVLVFSNEKDARRVLDVLPKRFGKYGLRLHPEKTRLLRFTPPQRKVGESGREAGPSTFDFLGFTHYWDRSLRGYWVVKRKTARSRFGRALKRLGQWCRANRHQPIGWQQEQLARKLRGHDAYYGITGNARALHRLREELKRVWRKWLSRRSHRARLTWARFLLLLQRYPLPAGVIFHRI